MTIRYVPGEGKVGVSVMIVGLYPSEEDAKYGRPFIDTYGGSLRSLIDVNNTYLTNIIKVTTKETPTSQEYKSWLPLLGREILVIGPSTILCLGIDVAKLLLPKQTGIMVGSRFSRDKYNLVVVPSAYEVYKDKASERIFTDGLQTNNKADTSKP